MESPSPERWMREAIRLSRRGFPAPNPHVGCVVVSKGQIVGRGWHKYAGTLHAEAMALQQAGERARGAEVFVTLEPCNHVGRQPACTGGLIRAGVAKVTYAVEDPNPRVAGGGAARLRKAGIVVETGLLREEAEAANHTWLAAVRRGRPFVTLKAAMSLDGRIALPSGESKWITGERARAQGRLLRAEMGAVLAGSKTIECDDPQLTVRDRRVKNPPVRIVLDPERVLGEHFQVFRDGLPTLRVVSQTNAVEGDLAVPEVNGRFDLFHLLKQLGDRGITGLLVEGGAQTMGSFLQADLVDRIDLFIGNVPFGGGKSWLDSLLGSELRELHRWSLEWAKRLGDDVWLRYGR